MHRPLFCALIALSFGCLGGCNEFTTTGERTTAVDVVGEPNDPTPDSMEQSDIYGAGNPLADETESIVEARPIPANSLPSDDHPTENAKPAEEPDVAGGIGTAKPVSLKTKKNAKKDSGDSKLR